MTDRPIMNHCQEHFQTFKILKILLGKVPIRCNDPKLVKSY